MRLSLRLSTVLLCLLIVPMTSRPAFARTSVDRLRRSVDKLIEEARAATTEELADEKLNEADRLLDKARRIDEIERAFARADVKQIRGRIHMTWARNLGHTREQGEAYDLLRSVSDDYEKLVERCEDKAEQSSRRQRNVRGQRERLPISEQNTIRARYKWAWAEYYVAEASDAETRRARFNKALEKFNEFTADGDPNQVYIARCFNSKAHCLYELERYSEIVKLLDPERFEPRKIQPGDKDKIREIFKNATLLRVKAHQKLEEHDIAESFAKQYFDALPKKAKLDATELEIAILSIRSLGALVQNDESLLTRTNYLSSLIRPYGVQWRARLAEELYRIGIRTPYWYLSEAKTQLNNRNYERALSSIERGLKEAGADKELSAKLRYIKFVTLLKLSNWRQTHLAAKEFLEHHPEDDRAAEICSWGIKSGLEALNSEPPLETETLLEFLEHGEQNFPGNSEAEKIPWYKGYLLYLQGRYPASKQTLETIEPNSPVYPRAQHCLAMASYKRAEALIKTGGDKEVKVKSLLGETAAALCRFADSSPKDLQQQDRQLIQRAVELTIATSRCLLNLDSPDPNTVLKLHDRMQPFQEIVRQSEGRWLAQRIRADIMTGNIKSATENVATLLEKAPGAESLIDISKLLERASASLTENGKNSDALSVDRKLVMIYTALLENHISKSTDERMRANEASARLLLAQRYQRLHEYRKAIEHYEWYMNNATKEESSDIIRSLAISYERINKYDLALPRWRRLFRGLEKRTNGWIEAAYHLIDCNVKAGNYQNARKTLDYFKILCPQSERGDWGRKFEALDKDLSAVKLSTGS